MRWAWAAAFILVLGTIGLGQGTFGPLETPRQGALIPLTELKDGGPPPQGIPALGFGGSRWGKIPPSPEPRFVTVREARAWLDEREPVLVLSAGDETRAYPLQILVWHEIVNDTVGNVPIAITFCPLCNSGLAYRRRLALSPQQAEKVRRRNPKAALEATDEGWALEVSFGTSGLLYKSNLVLFDNITGSLWSQILGKAVVGTLAGVELETFPIQLLPFGAFVRDHPSGLVLSRKTGYQRNYGENPYLKYDSSRRPFLFEEALDRRLPAMARVVTVRQGGEAAAYPFSALEAQRVVNDCIGTRPIAIFWQPGTASALDAASIALGRDVGSSGVFDRRVAGRELAFVWDGERILDLNTRSSWDLEGRATSGILVDTRLTPIPHDNTFWFAWAAFFPDTRIYPDLGAKKRCRP